MLLAIRFKVEGSLRFLSHAETLKLFQRACVRAGLRIRYSEGFNPRPKLSLPLPRPVGVESDQEILCLRVVREPLTEDPVADEQRESRIKESLARQLPEGCELISVGVADAGASFAPRSVTYVFSVRAQHVTEELKATIERLLSSEHLPVRRPMDEEGTNFKNVDIRGFLKSIKQADGCIIVQCAVSPAGTARVEEILTLLGLDESKLARPVRRTSIEWQND